MPALPRRAGALFVGGSCALWLLLAAAGDGMRNALRYERSSIAAGELWRLATAHIVHLDLAHAALNSAGLVLVAALFGRVFGALQWAFVLLLSVLAIDAGLWFLHPGLTWYVGASGLLHGAMAAGILERMFARDWTAWALGLLGSAKLLYEHFSGALPLTTAGFAVVTDAHLYGAAAGVAGALVLHFVTSARRPFDSGAPRGTR
jgi:rhomboid family GlyGly-CTERM serine protease